MTDNPDLETMLTDDFLLLLDLCRDPGTVFKPESKELCIAQHWLEKLCCYECDDLPERLLRNVYISNLCVCLIEGVLKGPFIDMPKEGKLENANFNLEATPPRPQRPSRLPGPTRPCPMNSKVRERKECVGTTFNRQKSNCEQVLDPCAAPFSSGRAKQPTFPAQKDLKTSAVLPNISSTAYSQSQEEAKPDQGKIEELREDISSLLKAISAELRGKASAGSNPYLESELERYQNFMAKLQNSCLQDVMHSKEGLRSFLLLNLQNDLLKLMIDNY